MPAFQFGLDVRPCKPTGGEQYQCMIYQIGNFCDNAFLALPLGGQDDLDGLLAHFFYDFVLAQGKESGCVRAGLRMGLTVLNDVL